MTQYFSNFPSIQYRLPNMSNSLLAVDVTKRFILRDFYRRTLIDFYRYDVIEGQRPDNVAYDFYGDSNLDWLILLPNEMIDPYYEWPRTQYEINEYLRNRYGSVSNAQATVHHYEQIIQTKSSVITSDGDTIDIPEKTLIVDQTTYTSLSPIMRKAVTVYDFEISKNEKNRTIDVIKPSYVPAILDAFRSLYA